MPELCLPQSVHWLPKQRQWTLALLRKVGKAISALRRLRFPSLVVLFSYLFVSLLKGLLAYSFSVDYLNNGQWCLEVLSSYYWKLALLIKLISSIYQNNPLISQKSMKSMISLIHLSRFNKVRRKVQDLKTKVQ